MFDAQDLVKPEIRFLKIIVLLFDKKILRALERVGCYVLLKEHVVYHFPWIEWVGASFLKPLNILIGVCNCANALLTKEDEMSSSVMTCPGFLDMY